MTARPTAPSLPLRTERLVLRPALESDVEALVAYRGDPEVCRWLPFEPQDAGDVRERVAAWHRHLAADPAADQDADWALTLVADHEGVVVGDVMLRLKGGTQRSIAEVGYVFHPGHGGRGLATEAARAVTGLAFDHFGCHRVHANLDPRNAASARLCERLGMRHEAHLRRDWWDDGVGEWTDSAIYGLLREEWDAAR
ncbi:GNAT family N-acetyltransferase [Nocardioides dongxiaopingii]|uniref:GNAT family N-acetyltransferase n=1 Tax=Nocardioides sp. S-1144 TaxID=2582905 RepID=UPI00110F373B|nr:GNAT family protein [Nocardioides sp. S-1144]QCW51740.1 GNAT family N-acetyltransferase [Nocardioides sp. S-1144]